MSENAVEGDSSFFVSVEALIEEVAQKPSILRNAFPIDARRRSNRIGNMLGIRSKVANSREAAAGYNGIGDDINIFVDLPRLEAAVQMNVAVAGHDFAVHGVRELPLAARNNGARSLARITDGEHIARIVRRRDGVFDSADAA